MFCCAIGETFNRIFNCLKPKWISRIMFLTAVIVFFQMLYYSKKDLGKNWPVKTGRQFVLLWTDPDYHPFYFLLNGQETFIRHNCSVTNCFVTSNKNLFHGDLSRFDAIAFGSQKLAANDLPTMRYSHQKYIFISTEPADYVPVCDEKFDGFFNWTATYKLDSDIPYPYFVIKDNNGNIVGPRINMTWNISTANNDYIRSKVQNKTKTAAWFVTRCDSRSQRFAYAQNLQKQLNKYGLALDIFGYCGDQKCAKERQFCDKLLQKDYYFYLALENSFCEDYVSEKVLHALQNFAVPVVYGSANYSRFLPPSSYLSANATSPRKLAKIMKYLIENPDRYYEYFWWHSHYSFHSATAVNICGICEILNDVNKFENISVYENFRSWWHSNYKDRCVEPRWWTLFENFNIRLSSR